MAPKRDSSDAGGRADGDDGRKMQRMSTGDHTVVVVDLDNDEEDVTRPGPGPGPRPGPRPGQAAARGDKLTRRVGGPSQSPGNRAEEAGPVTDYSREGLRRTAFPAVITTAAKRHQEQALTFMRHREGLRGEVAAGSLQGDKDKENAAPGRPSSAPYSAPNSGHGQEGSRRASGGGGARYCTGGIVADDMGLGKTMQVLGLVYDTASYAQEWASGGGRRVRATLVVCPKSLCASWEAEMEKHVNRASEGRYLVFHGGQRDRTGVGFAHVDVVVTTYGMVAAELCGGAGGQRGGEGGPLTMTKWFRVVLDEAHEVRTEKTQTAKAIAALEARSRWALTGTPIHNSLADLLALFRSLRVWEPHLFCKRSPLKGGEAA